MQTIRPSGWTSSPKLPAEKRPRMRRRAWLNTGRASSGHAGAAGLAPSSSSSSLPLLCIEHTLLEFTLPWHFYFPFERTTQSFLCHFNLILMTTRLLPLPSPCLLSSLRNTTKKQEGLSKPPMPLYVCGSDILFLSVFSTAGEDSNLLFVI